MLIQTAQEPALPAMMLACGFEDQINLVLVDVAQDLQKGPTTAQRELRRIVQGLQQRLEHGFKMLTGSLFDLFGFEFAGAGKMIELALINHHEQVELSLPLRGQTRCLLQKRGFLLGVVDIDQEAFPWSECCHGVMRS